VIPLLNSVHKLCARIIQILTAKEVERVGRLPSSTRSSTSFSKAGRVELRWASAPFHPRRDRAACRNPRNRRGRSTSKPCACPYFKPAWNCASGSTSRPVTAE
jgi:hypothetical protein